MQVSEAQSKAMDALIRGEKTLEQLAVRTRQALLDKGLVTSQGLVTQEGLRHVSVAVIDVDVITFGKEVIYNHPLPPKSKEEAHSKQRYTTLKFPKGTEMIATFPIEAGGGRVYYEGMINVSGKPLWVRIAHAPHFTFAKKLMPLKDK